MKGSSQSNLLILSKSKPFKYGIRGIILFYVLFYSMDYSILWIILFYGLFYSMDYTSTKVFSIFSCNGFKSCLISIRQMISLIKSLTKSSINEPLGLSIHTWGSYTMRGTSSVIVNHRLCRVQERFLVLHVWQPFFLVCPPLPPWSSFWEYPPLWSSFS